MNINEFINAVEELFYEDESPIYIINRLDNQRITLVKLIN